MVVDRDWAAEVTSIYLFSLRVGFGVEGCDTTSKYDHILLYNMSYVTYISLSQFTAAPHSHGVHSSQALRYMPDISKAVMFYVGLCVCVCYLAPNQLMAYHQPTRSLETQERVLIAGIFSYYTFFSFFTFGLL